MARKLSIQAVNELNYNDFISTFANVVEHMPLCAAAVCNLWEFRHWDLSVYWQSARRRKSGNPAQLSGSIWSLGIFVYTRLYKEKFGFPLVICARLNNKETSLERIRERLSNDSYQELNNGIKEVKEIMVLRVKDVVNSETSKI